MPPEEYLRPRARRDLHSGLGRVATGKRFFLDYQDLPPAPSSTGSSTRRARSGIAAERATMAEVARFDAKNPVLLFSDDRERKEREATPALELAADRWVRPPTRSSSRAELHPSAAPLRCGPLRADIEHAPAEDWIPHFNTSYYEGNWSGVALRSIGGVSGTIYPTRTLPALGGPEILARCPALAAAVDAFDCTRSPPSGC